MQSHSSSLFLLVLSLVFLSSPARAGGALLGQSEDSLRCTELPFVYNIFWTTECGRSYALSYYSGPEPMPCQVDRDRGVAVCECYALEHRAEPYHYFVDINAILNTCVYIETVRACGHDGSWAG